MHGFWRRRNEFAQLEARLRAERPEASDELVRHASEVVQNARRGLRLHRLRLALVGVLTVALVAILSAFGGFTVVASGANGARTFVTTGSFSKHDQSEQQQAKGNTSKSEDDDEDGDDDDPDDDQYDDKITICHRPPGNPSNAHTLRLPSSAAQAHLANHPDDTTGPCPDDD
jgi:hypothetical protein